MVLSDSIKNMSTTFVFDDCAPKTFAWGEMVRWWGRMESWYASPEDIEGDPDPVFVALPNHHDVLIHQSVMTHALNQTHGGAIWLKKRPDHLLVVGAPCPTTGPVYDYKSIYDGFSIQTETINIEDTTPNIGLPRFMLEDDQTTWPDASDSLISDLADEIGR